MLENDTLWGGTYLYGLYMGVPPPPSPPQKKKKNRDQIKPQLESSESTFSQPYKENCISDVVRIGSI